LPQNEQRSDWGSSFRPSAAETLVGSIDAIIGEMSIGRKPAAEVVIDESLVRALLLEQHADLAELPMVDVGEGWDNKLFRLGDELAVRVPRRAIAAPLIDQEQRWLPALSPRLPVPIPAPVRIGRPGSGFPWSWSVVPWFAGQSASIAEKLDLASLAHQLGAFVRALHHPAPSDAPTNPWRASLQARATTTVQYLDRVESLVDRRAVLEMWERALSTPPWTGPPLWLHGDLHPGNLLIHDGRLAAVIDFGDMTSGDPAIDLSAGWGLFPASLRSAFRHAARYDSNPVDDDTWMRARGWALTLGLAYLANSKDDAAFSAVGLRYIEMALENGSR
jgi:aminoglycoside phosphotransferase (APT) family kinase protein